MNGNARVDSDALIALANWKAVFADEVCQQARQIAKVNGTPERITVSHYQQAAVIAVKKLAAEIEQVANDAQRKAA